MLQPLFLARIAALVVLGVLALAPECSAQSMEWGAKVGLNSTSANDVGDYYDWLLCCHPLDPDARVDASSAIGFAAGVSATSRVSDWFGIQGEVLFSRKRHSVNLEPYQAIDITFSTNYVEAVGLARFDFLLADRNSIYAAAGPAFGFRVGEDAKSSEPSLKRGDSETDVYALQLLVYSAPELLKGTQTSIAIVGGWEYRRLVIEFRLTQGLQSIFKDRESVVSAFVDAGGHEPTLRRLIGLFGPFLEAAKSRDMAVMTGFRF